MKKILILLLGVAIVAVAAIAIAGVNAPGINGTPHNIPIAQTKTGTEPCAYCHTPHVVGAVIYPLWNRSQATQTYSMYTSPTFNMYTGSATKADTAVDMSTRACMTCHNGVAAELINYPGRGTNKTTQTSFYGTTMTWGEIGNLGTDLRQEHPVAFTYNPSVDQEGNNFPTAVSGRINSDGGANYLPLYGTSIDGTRDQMGCGTCHEVHDRYSYLGKSTDTSGTQVFFLRNSSGQINGNADSALCRVCHRNKY